MSLISKRDADLFGINRNEYNLTEFILGNNTNAPVVFNLFDTNTLTNIPTQPAPTLPPSVFGTGISIGADSDPTGMAYNPITNTIYVANSGNDSVSVIDCNTNSVINTIILPAASSPVEVAYNPISNTMYVTCNNANTVSVIDCNTNSIVGLPINVGTAPLGISYNTLNNTMYVAHNSSHDVYVIDCSTNLVVGLPIPVQFAPVGITYNSINNTMYVCNSNSDTISVINCNTNLVISTIPVGTFPVAAAYNVTNNVMYIANTFSSDVYLIDCNTNTLIGLPISVGLGSLGIVYNSLLNLMYVANVASVDISVIDCSTNLVVNTIATPSPVSTLGIVFNVTDNTFYVSSNNTDDISVLSPAIVTTTYIGGSDNYNTFVRDVMNNPMSVKDIMFYSNTPANLNQVIYTTKKDANGIAVYEPQIPSLSINVGQFQASIAKLDFGDKGFTLDTNSSLSNFTVAPKSEVKLILVQQQIERSALLPQLTDNSDLTKNEVETVEGVTRFNDVVPLYKTSIGEYFKNVIVSTQNDAEYEDTESSEEESEESSEESNEEQDDSSENISGVDSTIIEQDIKSDIKNQKTLVFAVSLLLIAGALYYFYNTKKTA
jgi:YVTN family beta-propeller protein